MGSDPLPSPYNSNFEPWIEMMDGIPRPPDFPKQSKGAGGGGKGGKIGSKISFSWQSYREFVTKHNTKLVALWGACVLLSLGYYHYERTQGRNVAGMVFIQKVHNGGLFIMYINLLCTGDSRGGDKWGG